MENFFFCAVYVFERMKLHFSFYYRFSATVTSNIYKTCDATNVRIFLI